MEEVFFRNPSAMTPLFPESLNGELRDMALELARATAKLGGTLNYSTRLAMAILVRPMNSYYSNLIESHFTHPREIERALNNDYSHNPAKRILQIEGKAHVRVNRLLGEKIKTISPINKEFICWIHKEFYKELPEELQIFTTKTGKKIAITPGELRKQEVEVGRHLAPASDRLDSFMELFVQNYSPEYIKDPLKRIIAIAASHHRLAWIHPFQDGNGRMLRLLSEAYFIHEDLHADGMWSISRGLAVYKNDYYTALQNADLQRFNDYDGRGNLSDSMLGEFCRFFLKTAIDQVRFMTNLFEVDTLIKRVNRYVDIMVVRKKMRTEARHIIIEAILRGQLHKSELAHITGRSESTARSIMNMLLEDGILRTDSDVPRTPLYINFPVKVAPFFFPKLFPKDIEATLDD